MASLHTVTVASCGATKCCPQRAVTTSGHRGGRGSRLPDSPHHAMLHESGGDCAILRAQRASSHSCIRQYEAMKPAWVLSSKCAGRCVTVPRRCCAPQLPSLTPLSHPHRRMYLSLQLPAGEGEWPFLPKVALFHRQAEPLARDSSPNADFTA